MDSENVHDFCYDPNGTVFEKVLGERTVELLPNGQIVIKRVVYFKEVGHVQVCITDPNTD